MRICIFGDARSVHLQRIIPGLAKRGLEVHVVTHKPAEVPGATVERFTIPPPRLTNPFRWRARWMRYLHGFMRRFDVVHVHFLQDWGFTPEIMESGCFMASPWGSDIVQPPGEEVPSRQLHSARLAMLRHAVSVTTWGPSFAAVVADYADLDVSAIELLPLGVDLSLFRPIPSTPRDSRDGHQVGFFKGFRPVYGATYLMRAIPTVVEAFPDVRFHMVGDGPQLTKCQELAGLGGVQSHVHWIPRQPHRNIPNHLAGWDLTVIPSICESFGAAALESSALSVPVVGTDVGGMEDTIRHGETGLLVPPRAPEQLADAIITLLRDDDLRGHMGIAGRAMVERDFEWGTILDEWVRVYEAARDRVAVMV